MTLSLRFAALGISAALAGSAAFSQAAPVISEFMAVNRGPDADEDGRTSDWIEIANPGGEGVDLSGWFLTDDAADLHKWEFPAVTVPAGGHLVVWASGADRRNPDSPLHTNFALAADGEYLALVPPEGPAVSVWDPYPKQFPGYSYGLLNGESGWFASPTPGAPNTGPRLTGYAAEPTIGRDRGFCDAPFAVPIATETAGAGIRYTTDGSAPDAENGTVYSGPIPISTTTVLRAQAFGDGLVPSAVVASTYLFPETWIAQPAAPAGFPETWGNPLNAGSLDPNVLVAADYGMDPEAAADPELRAALTQSLPVLSVAGSVEDLFGFEGASGNGRHSDAEFPVSVEFFDPLDAGSGFGARASLEAHGGAVREFAKKAWRLDFSGGSADGALRYPLFPGTAGDTFDQLVLRTGGHDSFTARTRSSSSLDAYDLAPHGSYLRDQFLRRTENELGLLSPRGRYVHLCLNGLYWGIYDLHERPNAEYAVIRRGGDEGDWDIVRHTQRGQTGHEIATGDGAGWTALADLAAAAESQDDFEAIAALTGPDALFDHLLVRIWAGDNDWLAPGTMPGIDGVNPTGNIAYYRTKNWYALRNSRAADPRPWEFFTWDGEISMGTHLLFLWPGVSPEFFPANFQWPVAQRELRFDFTGIDSPDSPAAPFAALMWHPEFRLRMADRIRRMFFGAGALSPASAQTRVAAMVAELDQPMLAEAARWGDVSGYRFGLRNGTLVQFWDNPKLTRDANWRPEVAWLRDTFAVQRAGIVIDQFRARGIYPATDPADIDPPGGPLPDGETVTLTTSSGDDEILYTLDGSDPRVAFTGEPSAAAQVYAGPIANLHPPVAVTARVRRSGEWSALTEAAYSAAVPAVAESLALTELHYHPPDATPEEVLAGFVDGDDFEFLQLTNVSDVPVSLAGLRFTAGIAFDFDSLPGIPELAAGSSMVIASNPAAFAFRYGFEPAGGFADGTRLSNSGETLTLVDAAGNLIAEVAWQDGGEWPAAADGTGASLHLLAPHLGTAEGNALNWRADSPSPGSIDTSPMTWARWQSDFFSSAESALATPEADPDADGIPNAIEFVTKSHPRLPSPNPLAVEPAGGAIRLTWERRADTGPQAPTASCELSANAGAWSPASNFPGVTLSESLTADATLRQSIDVPADATRLFARLRTAW